MTNKVMSERWLRAAAGAALLTAGAAALEGCPPPPAAPAMSAPTVYVPPRRTRRLATAGASASLSRLTQDPLGEFEPALSPDGRTLVFWQAEGDERNLRTAVIASVDAATGARRTLWTPSQSISISPSWVPGGGSLIYISNRSGPAALVRSLSASPNSGVAILVDEAQAPMIGAPAVSPEGRRVVAQARMGNALSIVSFTLGTNEYAVLGEGSDPCFDPLGARVFFTRVVGGTSQIYSMRATDGTDVMQLTQGEYSARQPAVSPDGQWIIFAMNRSEGLRGPATDGRWNLFATRADGSGGLTQVTDGEATNRDPHWGTDGWIYFSSNSQDGNYDIWKLRPQGDLAPVPFRAPPAGVQP